VPSIKSLHLEYDEAIEALIQKKLNLDSKVCKLKGFDPKNLECKLTYSRVLQR
jgi:hypothetical protein